MAEGPMQSQNLFDLRAIFSTIFAIGPESIKVKWNGSNPLMRLFADDLLSVVTGLLENSRNTYHVFCRTGASGKWALTPYCAILSPKYNYALNGYTPSRGIFPAYLLNVDLSELYLVYMMGVGSRNERTINNIATTIKSSFELQGFNKDTSTMQLGKDRHNYKIATFWFKKYEKNNLPDNKVLVDDLLNLVNYHEIYGPKIYEIVDQITQSKH